MGFGALGNEKNGGERKRERDSNEKLSERERQRQRQRETETERDRDRERQRETEREDLVVSIYSEVEQRTTRMLLHAHTRRVAPHSCYNSLRKK
jgi:hypothetical protein